MKKLDRNFIKAFTWDKEVETIKYLLSFWLENIEDSKKIDFIKSFREKQKEIKRIEFKTLQLIG